MRRSQENGWTWLPLDVHGEQERESEKRKQNAPTVIQLTHVCPRVLVQGVK